MEDKETKQVQDRAKQENHTTVAAGSIVTDPHAIAALVLGIISVVSPFQLFGLGGLVGVILGTIGLYQANVSGRYGSNSLAHSGKVLSIIGVVVSALALLVSIFMVVQLSSAMHGYWNYRTFDMMGPRMTYFHRYWF